MNIDEKNEFKNFKGSFNINYYFEYLTLINMKKRMKEFGLSSNEIENKIYNNLSDVKKIKLEYQNIVLYLKNNINYISNLPKSDLLELTDLFTTLKNKIKKLDYIDSFDEIKKIIFKIQVKLNLEATFYTITDSLLEEYKTIRKEK